jgi:3-deoxy-D-manno-octulosonate 8-phosphate phosphatase (KDO 8-P phosphatase)
LASSGLVDKFAAAGGRFVSPVEELTKKLDQCRAIVFDWDGVFNSGRKGGARSSGFSEADSMGTNMLRYGLWRRLGELPYTAIISGENNEAATAFAGREHLAAIYSGIRKKQDVIAHLCAGNDLQPAEIACVFDDINDLPMAEACGLRFMVRRDASPLFTDYVERRGLCDYVTGAQSGGYPVREICELLLGLLGDYDAVVASRVAGDADYEDYFKARQAAGTAFFAQAGDAIAPRES